MHACSVLGDSLVQEARIPGTAGVRAFQVCRRYPGRIRDTGGRDTEPRISRVGRALVPEIRQDNHLGIRQH